MKYKLNISFEQILCESLKIRKALDVVNLLSDAVKEAPCQESFFIVALDAYENLIGWHRISLGSYNCVQMDVKMIFRILYESDANSFIICHNHPSGNPEPSAADSAGTRRLREMSKILECFRFIDHVILGDCQNDPCGKGYYSFAENGLL